LVIAPSIALDSVDVAKYAGDKTQTEVIVKVIKKEVLVTMESNDDGTVKATVTTTTIENDEEVVVEIVFEGTEEEVKSKIDALEDADVKVKKVEKINKEVEKIN